MLGDERLHGIEFGIKVRVPRRNDPRHRPQDRGLRTEHPHALDFANVGTGRMVVEDALHLRGNPGATRHLAAVESDHVAILGEWRRKGRAVAAVPAVQQTAVQLTNLRFAHRVTRKLKSNALTDCVSWLTEM